METLVLPEQAKVQTVSEIAASDIRKAEVFKKFGIEFCCRGNKPLQTACTELNLDINEVEAALTKATSQSRTCSFDFNKWQPDFLADYICNEHHAYFYQEYPEISKLLERVVSHHSKNYPQLTKIQSLIFELERELIGHFAEEENVIFPIVKEMMGAKRLNHTVSSERIKELEAAGLSMKNDHEDAGDILAQLREVTEGYNPPAGTCNSFKFLYHKLKSLEEDLHQHIHLENNVLFPKVTNLRNELLQLNLVK
jgi:regulator of cell morphogenesis and NO signaling